MLKTNYTEALSEVRTQVNAGMKTVPGLRNSFKKGYSFSKLEFEEQLMIWEYVWKNASDFHVKTQPFFYCEKHAAKEEHSKHGWKVLKHWQNEVNDWAFCDSLSKIYTRHLEFFPEEVYAQLVKWNKDKDLWKRRQSIVSLLYYSRTKKIHLSFNKIIPLINNLLHDEEYYVQKGVGWSLRELHNVYPEKTFEWVRKNIKSISAVAFSAATEKLETKRKNILKQLRK
ncbi:MAG TPA: DNA alkylation repair protein [Bacteroidia bacterium]|jgi:3-methyladenine DNA glycosylase AlkD|nr:DNA alkylation repair protein [Bacteroidia bacterium]